MMERENLVNIIAECDRQLENLRYEDERNRDLYIEGYGDSRTLRKCTRKIEKEISRVSKKRNDAIKKCKQLGIDYNANTNCTSTADTAVRKSSIF